MANDESIGCPLVEDEHVDECQQWSYCSLAWISQSNSFIPITLHNNPSLLLNYTLRPLLHHHRHSRHFSIRAVENYRHLLERVASSLRVEKVYGERQDDQHHDEDDVVFPADALERDGVDEGIEENRNHGC